MAHVFISYKHEDSEFAALLKLQLIDAGFEAWLDEERLRAGEDWREAIDKAIRQALALIVIVTPEAKASEYVTYEWACAWGAGVPVISLLLKPTELHPRLEALQYLDFTDRKARPWNRLNQELEELNKKYHPNTIHVSRDAPRSIKNANDALDSHNPNERHAAIDSLVQNNHPAAFDVLANAALYHHIRDVRVIASFKVAELSQFEDRRAVPGLIEALCAKDWSIFGDNIYLQHTRAAESLGKLKDATALPALVEILCNKGERAEPRQAAAYAIGNIGDGDASAINALKSLIESETADVDLRQVAAIALVQIGTSQAIDSLRSAWNLLEEHLSSRGLNQIINNIGKQYHKTYQSQLMNFLTELLDTTSGQNVKAVFEFLAETGSASLPLISARLSDARAIILSDPPYGPYYSTVSELASKALKKIGTPEALAALEKWKNERE